MPAARVTPLRRARRRATRGGSDRLLAGAVLAVAAAVLTGWAALAGGRWATGEPVPANPVGGLAAAARHGQWPWQSTVIAAALTAAGTPLVVRAVRQQVPRTWADAKADSMTPARELTMGRKTTIEAANQRLLEGATGLGNPLGPRLGVSVHGGLPLYLPPEIGMTCIAGTRTGKTTAWAVPAVLDAWGPVITTSNKPDLYRHTRFGREHACPGSRIWVCDLQGVTGQAHTGFWWNPLAHIHGLGHARRLAQGSFVSASRDPGARPDAYFDPEAQELFSLYTYAAALAGGDLLHTAQWLGSDQDPTAVLILQHHAEADAARRIRETQALTARQRDGIYGMARRFLNVLTEKSYALAVTPPVRRRIIAHEHTKGISVEVTNEPGPPRHQLPEFDPAEFVTSRDTLYLLSMEGPDSATALMTALAGQILDAALAAARVRPSGRLAVPLLGVFDEAANCCKLGGLPDYYSYAGGHGIVLMTFLQGIEQGQQLWGTEGMNTMRSQSVEVYGGGGITDASYRQYWSAIIGQHDVSSHSRRAGRGGSDTTTGWQAEPIFDEAALAALPTSHALIRYPGNAPVLARKTPWHTTQHAATITESVRRYGEPAIPPTGQEPSR